MGNKDAKPASAPKNTAVAVPQRKDSQQIPPTKPTTQPPQFPPTVRETRFTLKDFVVLNVIGRGSFGTVYLVRKADDDKVFF